MGWLSKDPATSSHHLSLGTVPSVSCLHCCEGERGSSIRPKSSIEKSDSQIISKHPVSGYPHRAEPQFLFLFLQDSCFQEPVAHSLGSVHCVLQAYLEWPWASSFPVRPPGLVCLSRVWPGTFSSSGWEKDDRRAGGRLWALRVLMATCDDHSAMPDGRAPAGAINLFILGLGHCTCESVHCQLTFLSVVGLQSGTFWAALVSDS